MILFSRAGFWVLYWWNSREISLLLFQWLAVYILEDSSLSLSARCPTPQLSTPWAFLHCSFTLLLALSHVCALKEGAGGRIGGQCRLALGFLCHASPHTGWHLWEGELLCLLCPWGWKQLWVSSHLEKANPSAEFSSFRLLCILSSLMHF